jgi:hypothetical protein
MNFLRHLLQRSLAPATTLQPRLASRFEFNANPVRPTELAVETEVAAPVAPAPLPAVSGLAAQPAAPRAESAQSAAPLASTQAPPPPASPPVFAPPRPPTVLPVPPAATPAFAAPPPTVAPRATSSDSSAREVLSMPPASSSTLLIERVTERVRENYAVPANGSSLSAALPASPIAAPALTLTPPAPRATPVSPSTTPVAHPTVAPAAAPIIRVTIGRVDIRAIHPMPPASVRAPASAPRPLVSLETYLTQRDAK